MINKEKLRKRARINWKREIRKSYKKTMAKVKYEIKHTTDTRFYVSPYDDNTFASWIVMKKLNAAGIKAVLHASYNLLFRDELFINLED